MDGADCPREKCQINNLILCLKELTKEAQMKPKVSKRKKITNIRARINELETKKKTTVKNQ